MSDPLEIAVNALEEKAKELLNERTSVRRRLLEDAVRDVEIDRDIAGCIAGAQALGFPFNLPKGDTLSQQQQSAMQQFTNSRHALAGTAKLLAPLYNAAEIDGDEFDDNAPSSPEMPRIADIVLEQLRLAGNAGTKAADIRRYILNTYNADIHEKTVGMTLYRLQKEEKVRREGHTWFLAPQKAGNPGGATPGLINSPN